MARLRYPTRHTPRQNLRTAGIAWRRRAEAIRSIAAGGVYIDPRLANKLISSLVEKKPAGGELREKLTERERHVLRGIAEGFSIKEIAARLEISVKTVETYKARGMEKFGLRSRVDIVRMARQQGWLGPLDPG